MAAIVLLLRVLADSLFNIACAAVLLSSGEGIRKRERMRLLIVGRLRGAPLLAVAAVLAGLISGCTQEKIVPTGNAWTLDGHMQQLRWSVHATVDQSDAKKSLESDLGDMKTEQNWVDQLKFSAESMFLTPDARKSLESDLSTLGDNDWRTHGIKETLGLWGW
jgi:hypothetical protein